MDLSNVYFVIGTSYAGKSTVVRNLAKKHHGIELGENYHDAKLPELDSREFPNLTYTRDLQDWHEFIRRTPDEYVTWLINVKKECETVELQMLEELLEKPEAREKPVFVDTNISVETLHRITDTKHVLVMVADPETGIHRFFDRPDPEKQFLYRLMLEEPDPQAALDNYREILTRIHSKESYDELLNSGFRVIYRDEERSEEETVLLAEDVFGLPHQLKKLILLGDSIRMGYQPEAARILKGQMEVAGPAENGRWSGYILNSLRFWMPEWGTPDVIHLNAGLWDTGDDYGFGRPFTRPADYRENLELIIRVLREHYPDAKLILATTTPTLDRDQQVIRDFNEVLSGTAKREGVFLNDLYSLFAGKEEKYICPDKIHLTKEGFSLAAQQVVRAVQKALLSDQ